MFHPDAPPPLPAYCTLPLSGNSAGKSGGVLFVPACSVSVDGVEFDSNQAGVSGGAVALTDSHASFANVGSTGNAAVDQGGFLNAVDSDLVLSAVTDAAADASRGGSIYIERACCCRRGLFALRPPPNSSPSLPRFDMNLRLSNIFARL